MYRNKLIYYITGIFAFSALIINLYPSISPDHTAILTMIHLPLMLWFITGIAYLGDKWKSRDGRMKFIRFSGESFIYGTLIILGLIVLMLFIMMIFSSIGIDAESFIEN